MTRIRLLLLAAAYALLLAHLLFIPYAFVPLDPGAAVAAFAGLRWEPLGSDQNVAIVSRALMFLPLGILLAAIVTPRPGRGVAWMSVLIASVVGGAWALAVNFAQLWFPARTVLLNLVVAQFAGIVGGALAWAALGGRVRQWWRSLSSGGRVTLHAALGAYVVAYLLASLAPYDFVTSASELREKLASGLYGPWFAASACGPVSCNARLLLELALTIPCGLWFALYRRGASGTIGAAFVVGLLASLLIEGLQLLMVSGVSQGASLLSRSLGMAFGAAAYRWRHALRAVDPDRFGRPLVLLLALPYFAAVAFVGGWFRTPRAAWALAVEQARGIVWMPFFYLYYTPYTAVMQSLAVHTLLYVPVGAAVWLWSRRRADVSLWWAAVLAAAVALIAETSKILLIGRHPDYGDVGIAVAAACLALAVLRWLARPHGAAASHDRRAAIATAADGDGPVESPPGTGIGAGIAGEPPAAMPASAGLRLAWRIGGVVLLALAAWSLVVFPFGGAALAAAFFVYAALLWRWRWMYLLAVPLALPLLDLAPWSGRFFWDEIDVLLAVTLGVRLLGQQTAGAMSRMSALSKLALLVMALSVVASTLIAVLPPAPVDANAFSNYLSSYNALRVARGYLWAGALLWLIAADAAVLPDFASRLRLGLGLGLVAAVAGVFWERALYVGIIDLHSWFRAAGLVSATHVGGAYLEATLVALAPFALSLALGRGSVRLRIVWFAVVALSGVAVLMTLSRAAFAAWVVAVAIAAVGCLITAGGGRLRQAASRWRWAGVAAAMVLIAATVLLAQSTSLGVRLAQSEADLGVRIAQWRRSLQLVHGDVLHAAFGSGLGSFPREFYVAYGSSMRLPAYLLRQEGDPPRRFLSLSGGGGMYVDQRVAVAAGEEMRFSGLLRSPQGKANLSVALCEKSLLASLRCSWVTVPADATWRPFDVRLKAPGRDAPGDGTGALVALSLSNDAFGTRVDVTQLSLLAGSEERLRNGAFERGLDRWYMVSDRHLAWRAHSTPVQVLVEQGPAGLIAWALLALAVALRVGAARPPEFSAAIIASAVGLLAVGLFDSLLDSPRIVVLGALVLAGALVARTGGQGQRAADGASPAP